MRARKILPLGALMAIFAVRSSAQGAATVVRDTTNASAATLDWIAAHGSPLRAVDASADDRDLVRWDQLTASARVIGMGEQTHGTSEFGRVKLRLIQHGVLVQNVTVLGWENGRAPMAAIDRYVHGEMADVDSLMRGLSRLWQTEEVKAVFVWLRKHNETQRRTGDMQVDVVGIDVLPGPARDSGMAEAIAGEISRRPPQERAMVWSHNIHVAYAMDRMGPQLKRIFGARYVAAGFATASGTYRAHAPTDSAGRQSDGHVLPPAGPGSVEFNLLRISERVGGIAQLYDVRGIAADARGAWLSAWRDFHFVGTNVTPSGLQTANVGEMFDLLMFIPQTTSSHSLAVSQISPR